MSLPRILIIAGSDSGGGAGIQADIKTITMLGGYAMSAITAITAQNTQGVQAVYPLPPDMVVQQMKSCMSDIGVDAIKMGMLHDAEIIEAVAAILKTASVPMVLDPVMVATSGDRLLDDSAINALKELMRHVSLITPNIPEAELLSAQSIHTQEDMFNAARRLQDMLGGVAVLIKGGHLDGDEVHDLLYQEGEAFWFSSAKLNTPHTHGTGCTLASAITTIGAKGNPLFAAVDQARDYVYQAIQTAPGLGQGHGPIHHSHPLNS